jgi:chondroitin-sulfate-ABC endolyase/exolyase
MKRILLLCIFCRLLPETAPAVYSAIYSFEESIPAEFSGDIRLSTEKYKLGAQSLQWNRTAGATLTVDNPSGLSAAAQSARGGISLWIYNAVAADRSLTFVFRNSSGQDKCTFLFKLNFKGWRCLWARFADDMNHDRSPLLRLLVRAPADGQGTIWFDCLSFPTDVSWERMSDDQYTVASNGLDDFVRTRNANPTAFSIAPTDRERQAMQTIAGRLEAWFFPDATHAADPHVKARTKAFDNYVKRGRDKIAALNLTTAADGTVTGAGLFPQYAGTAIDGAAIVRFRDVNEQYLIQLAYDYRKNNHAAALDAALKILDWMHDQGWAHGSAMGTLRFEKLRSTGYFYALFLLRNALGAERRARELATLQWLSLSGVSFQTNAGAGENADDIRTLHIARLIYALSLPDEKAQLAFLRAFAQSLNRAFDLAHGYADTFKPDASGYHHRGAYYSAYYPEALYSACLMFYLLHDTPFALSDEIYDRLKQALLTFRFVCAGYDAPASASGRFPEGNTVMDGLLSAFACLILSKDTPDEALRSAFRTLWKPDVDPLKSRIARATTAITFQSTIGEVDAMVRVAALAGEAADEPKGIIYQPFAGLLTARTSHWLLSVKGTSKYVWDYEASASENVYGRYLSNGHIEWTSLQRNVRSFNSAATGWDWNRLPGATYKHLSEDELHYAATNRHRNFSSDAFLGGVVLNDSAALFAVSLADRTFDTKFRARKSVLIIGNAIYCLGSNISNEDAAHNTETALFQNALTASTPPVEVNGAPVTTGLSGLTRPVITDNYGNVYKIFSAGDVHIALSNSLATAWIDHGKAPVDGAYRYGILPEGAGDETVLSTMEVRQSDANAHCLYEPQSKTTAAAVFNPAGQLNIGRIRRVNAPSLILMRDNDDGLEIAFADPDMRQATASNADNLSDAAVATRGLPFNYELEIDGVFDVHDKSDGVQVAAGNGTTLVRATVEEGRCYRLSCSKRSGIDTETVAGEAAFAGETVEGGFRITSPGRLPFRCTVSDISGRKISQRDGLHGQHFLSTGRLPRGVFFITVTNDQHHQSWKVCL